VVTGVNSEGESTVVSDGFVPEAARQVDPETGAGGGDIWLTRVPIDLNDPRDPLEGYAVKEWPGPGEVVARMLTWMPGFEFPLHRSETLDIFYVIAGEIELMLEAGSTVLHVGDAAVQRGAMHGWRVVGHQPCTLAGVLIDAAPRRAA
jgi:quercetin dioxygenase-like cupin family protein